MSYPRDPVAHDVGVPVGSLIELEVEGLAAGGRGVARLDGRVAFVRGGLPGDRLMAAVVSDRGRFLESQLERLIQPSPDRVPAPCPFHGPCGGCPWMDLSQAGQIAWKRQLVVDALSRIGRLTVGVDPVRASPRRVGYRNKMEFTLGRDVRGRPCVGMHGEVGPLVDVASCTVQSDLGNRVLSSAREYLLDERCTRIAAFGARPEPHRLVIRVGGDGAACLVLFREAGTPFREGPALARHLAARHPEIVGVVRLKARPGQRGGGVTESLIGRDWLEEEVAGLTMRLPAPSFFQINSGLLPELVGRVTEACAPRPGLRAWDLYGGIGLHGLALARRGAKVTICEADPIAVRAGRAAVRAHGVRNVNYERADVPQFIERALRAGLQPDLVVANPPRAGLGLRVVRGLNRLRVKTLVLVSCDPATLARDLRGLIDTTYRVTHVTPFDLFPQTPHVETVCRLEGPGVASCT